MIEQAKQLQKHILDRIEEIALAVRKTRFVRTYPLKLGSAHIAEQFATLGVALTGELLDSYTLSVRDMKIEVRGSRGRKDESHSYWEAELYRDERYTSENPGELSEFMRAIVLNNEDEVAFYRMMRSIVPSEGPPSVFHTWRNGYTVKPSNTYHPKDENDKTGVLIQHLSTLIVAAALQLPNSRRTDEHKSLARQLLQFLITGNVPLNKPERIDISKPSSWPKPLLALSDYGSELVWKFGSYCKDCGKKLRGCFCEPTSKEPFDMHTMVGDRCWECTAKYMKHYLAQQFDDQFDEKTCVRLFDNHTENTWEWILEDLPHYDNDVARRKKALQKWKNEYGAYFTNPKRNKDGQYKTKLKLPMDDKTLAGFWDILENCWAEMEPGDPDDDSCSCPAWEG